MSITIPDTQLVRPVHDIQQIQGAMDGSGLSRPGPVANVAGTARPDGLPLFAELTPDNMAGFAGFGVMPPNTDDGALSVLFNTVIAGFAGVIPGKKVFIGSDGTLTQAISLVDAPDDTPTLTEGGAGALGAGTYKVAGAFVDSEGNESELGIVSSVTITASKKIHVADFEQPLPDGVDTVNWYVSIAAGSNTLKLVTNNDGAAFDINAVGTGASPLTSVSVDVDSPIGLGLAPTLIFFFGAGR